MNHLHIATGNTVSFTLERLQVIGMTCDTADDVVIAAELNYDTHCHLLINRKLFVDMLNGWLDAKADYCRRYEHFCGRGNVVIEGGDLIEGETAEGETPLFGAAGFTIDMEHG